MREGLTRKPVRARLQAGEAIIGVISNIPSPALSQLLALGRFDVVLMDMEHGPLTFESLEQNARAIQLVGAAPFARVMDNDPKLVLRALDAGAEGVMVPSVSNVEELERCIAAARFAPQGTRGLAMTTYSANYGDRDTAAYVEDCNEAVSVWPQLETAEAYENLDELLRVQGVDAFIIGPSDLSQSMGFPGQPNHPKVEAAVQDIIKRCRQAGRVVGTVASTPQRVHALRGKGAQIVLAGVNNLVIHSGREFVSQSQSPPAQ